MSKKKRCVFSCGEVFFSLTRPLMGDPIKHRNPQRAGIVRRLAGYRWSSNKVYAYGRTAPKWLSTDLILFQFAGDQDCHRIYREKVQKIFYTGRNRLLDVVLNNLSTQKGFREPKKKSGIFYSMVSGKPDNSKMNKSAICLG